LELFDVVRQKVTISFDGIQVVNGAGLLPIAEQDRRLGIVAQAVRRMPDPRWQLFVAHAAESRLR